MKPPAADFNGPQSTHNPDAELLTAIRGGHPASAMTKWADVFSEEDMKIVPAVSGCSPAVRTRGSDFDCHVRFLYDRVKHRSAG